MTVIPIDDLDDPRVADYRNVPDPELLKQRRLFVAEGRLVVRRLLTASSHRARSLLVTEAALRSLSDVLGGGDPGLPVYVCSQDLLAGVAGFNVHRGCLALGECPPNPQPDPIIRRAGLVVVLEAVGNADNMGGVFRNAAAFGAGGVLLSPTCCDPLYRKAIRTSMGTAFQVPYARLSIWPGDLTRVREAGLTTVGLTPRADAMDIGRFADRTNRPHRLALLFGTEGAGLSPQAESLVDIRVRIPISPSVDSLNLATAVGIALHRLSEIR